MAYRCRKNQARLTVTERARFVGAVLALKADGRYDQYVQDHMDYMANAHRGPAHLPWHREYLRRFELDLQSVDSTVTLPYWDWTIDNSAGSSIWDPDFMGGNGRVSDGQVLTGDFAFAKGNWPLNVEEPPVFGFLRRRFGRSTPSLPTPSDVALALTVTPYDVAPYNDGNALGGFRNRIEGWYSVPQLHNRVHVWVGGSMVPSSSPNDPVFFLNHCFEDKLWMDWQRQHGLGYLPTTPIAGRAGHGAFEGMEPWLSRGTNVTPTSVLDHHALGYAYDTEAVCAPKRKFFDDPLKLKFRDDPIRTKFKIIDDLQLRRLPEINVERRLGGEGTARSGRPAASEESGAMPFILSTPHHSLAWARFPGGAGGGVTLAQYEDVLRHYEDAIAEMNRASAAGELRSEDMAMAETVVKEFEALLAEYDALRRAAG